MPISNLQLAFSTVQVDRTMLQGLNSKHCQLIYDLYQCLPESQRTFRCRFCTKQKNILEEITCATPWLCFLHWRRIHANSNLNYSNPSLAMPSRPIATYDAHLPIHRVKKRSHITTLNVACGNDSDDRVGSRQSRMKFKTTRTFRLRMCYECFQRWRRAAVRAFQVGSASDSDFESKGTTSTSTHGGPGPAGLEISQSDKVTVRTHRYSSGSTRCPMCAYDAARSRARHLERRKERMK